MNDETTNIDPKKLETLKVWHVDAAWVTREQGRVKSGGKKKPTHAELFNQMRSVYEAKAPRAPEDRELFDSINSILQDHHGAEKLREFVRIEMGRLKPKARGTRGSARA